jgi:hypothetical protein
MDAGTTEVHDDTAKEGGRRMVSSRSRRWAGTAAGNVIGIVVAAFLIVCIGWYAATTIDARRNLRIVGQYNEDATVASMPLKPGMRPTPIAVVREEDGARIIAITVQDARRHRDDLLPGSLDRSEMDEFAAPSPMRDAFFRDLVQRISAHLDCSTGDLKALRMEVSRGLSDKASYVGPRLETDGGLPTKLDMARTQVICSLPVTRG